MMDKAKKLLDLYEEAQRGAADGRITDSELRKVGRRVTGMLRRMYLRGQPFNPKRTRHNTSPLWWPYHGLAGPAVKGSDP